MLSTKQALWAPEGIADLCEGPRRSIQPRTQAWGQREAVTSRGRERCSLGAFKTWQTWLPAAAL